MALGINTNLASLSAQRALNNTQSDTNTAMQRLSTGLRINSAKDDAAGMAVASRFTSQISGMQQASRNASDAVSMLQSAEGGLQSISDNLQRIRELAVQSASDSITDTDRGYLNTEVSQLVTEINRVADTTKYNGTTLLDGTYASSGLTFQVGADNSANDRMAVTIADFNTGAIGGSDAMALNIGAVTAGGNADSTMVIALAQGGSSTNSATLTGAKTATEIGTAITNLVNTINTANGNTNLSITGASSTAQTITSTDGTAFTITVTETQDTGTAATFAGGTLAGSAYTSGTAASSTTDTSNTIDQLSVATQAGAQSAIDQVDRALKEVNSGRATMGAFQSRFESVVSNLNLGAENATAGRSRVQDADFAVESANLAKNQVLQQAGMSVLAQANALPQQVLALLQ